MNRVTTLLLTSLCLAVPCVHASGIAAALAPAGGPLALQKAATESPIPSANTARSSTDYSDGWWNPSESGWGANVVQQEGSLLVFLYVYDENAMPRWFLATTTFVSPAAGYSGQLYTYTGPYFGAGTFNTIAVSATSVGTLSFTPSSRYDATLSYTVNGVQVTKAITRFGFAPVAYTGSYIAGLAASLSGTCPTAPTNIESTALVNINQSGSNMQVTFQGTTASCTLSGSFVQRGRLGQMESGSFTCSNGTAGTASIHELDTNQSGMTMIYSTLNGGCQEIGKVGGALR